MSRAALNKSLTAANWTALTNGTDKSKDALKTAVTIALKGIETQNKDAAWDALDIGKLSTAAEVAKRDGELAALKDAIGKISKLVDTAADAAKKFVKALGTPDKKIAEAAKSIETDGGKLVDAANSDLAAAAKALAEKQKAAAGAAKAAGVPAPVDKKALGLSSSYRKLGMTAVVNAQSKPNAKPARFMVVEFKTQALLYMGLKYDKKLTEGAMRALMQSRHLDEPFVKVWVDPNSKVIWEKDALTLVSDKIPNKLANRISKSSKLVLGRAYKVRMRNSKGDVAESDNKDVDKIDPAVLAKELAAMAPDPDADDDVDSVSEDSTEDSDSADVKKPAASAAPPDNKAAIALKADWVKARTSASAEVDVLVVEIRKLFPKGEHVAKLDEAESMLKKFMKAFASLDAELEAVTQQKDGKSRENSIRSVQGKIDDLRKLEKHPVMQNLDDNEVRKIKAGATLFSGLDRIEAGLTKELAAH